MTLKKTHKKQDHARHTDVHNINFITIGDPTVTMLIGGTKYLNQTHTQGTDSVEIMTAKGICKTVKIKLPYRMCRHRAVLIPLQEKVLLCGGFHNTSCGENEKYLSFKI